MFQLRTRIQAHRAARSRSTLRGRRPRARLILEALEDRCVPSIYTFTPIADTGPSSPYSGLEVGQAINNLGAVAFEANLKSGGAGIFTRNADGSQGPIIAITSDLIRDFYLSPYMNDSGTVVFGADLRDGTQALFTGTGTELTRIAGTGPDSPLSSLPPPAARIGSDGTVCFQALLSSGGKGFFLGDGGLLSILYVTGGRYSAFPGSPASQVHGDTVAFRATLTGGPDGVFRGNGLHTDTILTAGNTYSSFLGSEINDAGTVGIIANLTVGGQAIVIKKDGMPLTTFVDTSGPYSHVAEGKLSISNLEGAVFGADLAAGGLGIFNGPDRVADKILATGDEVFGSTVVGFPTNYMNPRALNNVGQIVFRVSLADGRTVLVRADPGTVSLTPSEASPQFVGERIIWSATATNVGEAPVYQFDVGPTGGPLHVVRDFNPTNSFAWAPMQEGDYDIRVTVKEGHQTVQTTSALVHYGVNSRVTGSEAVISPTANPLVALYSAPPGPEGTVHVEFGIASATSSWRSTDERTSVPGKSTNFFVAGMLPSTTYQMRYIRSDGTTSAPLLFTTGAISPSEVFPSFTVIQPPGPGSDLDQDMLFQQFANSPNNAPNPLATDLSGRVVWYYDVSQSGFTRTFPGQSLVPGGTVLILGVDRYAPALLPGTLDVLREIDLAGDSVRETNVDAVNAQLTTLGHNPIYSFTHDVTRLPNGGTAVIGLTERTVNINGTPTDFVGMTIIVLDEDFQVAWAWDAFDHLDVNRGPILGEILLSGGADQLALSTPRLPALDWVHINAVSWSPADGNLVVSVRNQDWVLKIDYENGGDGHVIWKLGQDGNFSLNNPTDDPNPWFSHQHNAHYIDDTTLVLFDNGDTRRASDPNADSRGQVWTLDEQTMTATLVYNADLGNYSSALGAAQRLSNGNYSFTSGFQGAPPNIFGQSIEVRPDGSKVYVLQVARTLYRSFRVRTLYEGTGDSLSADGGRGRSAGSSLNGSVPSSASNPAVVNSDPVNGFGASFATPRTNLDDLGVAVAMASTAPINQLATPTTIGFVFRGNQAQGGAGVTGGTGEGGAIANELEGAILNISHCTLSGNAALGGAGSDGGNGGDGWGGGLYVGSGTVSIEHTRIIRNEALGGQGATDGQGVGGGVYVAAGTVRVHNVTIRHNEASASDDDVFGDLEVY
jgi:arylsulfate sulfotransferase